MSGTLRSLASRRRGLAAVDGAVAGATPPRIVTRTTLPAASRAWVFVVPSGSANPTKRWNPSNRFEYMWPLPSVRARTTPFGVHA